MSMVRPKPQAIIEMEYSYLLPDLSDSVGNFNDREAAVIAAASVGD
jgi:hypothetical protein